MAGVVDLGTIKLFYASEREQDPLALDKWVPLDPVDYSETRWTEESSLSAELVSQLLKETSVGAVLVWRLESDGAVIRISVQPNDHGSWGQYSAKRAKLLGRLLHLLDKDWNGGGGKLLHNSIEDLETDTKALYALIQDPPEPSFGEPEFFGDEQLFAGLTEYENPQGVKTMMYKYQLTDPGLLVDPNYVRLTDPQGGSYYVNQQMNIIRHPMQHTLGPGGILCEQMGVGKTLICLALVLVSKRQYTRPPDDHDVSDVVSEAKLRTYPTPDAAALREAVGLDAVELIGTPSLASFCADIVGRLYPSVTDVAPGVSELVANRTYAYYKFPPPSRPTRSAKPVAHIVAQHYLLANATLVVVPAILVPQWAAEAQTHLDEGALSILIVKEGKEALPPVEELIRYDIVLMSLERFRREGHREDPYTIISSELLGVRWKRIILDEGNIANNIRSDAMMLAGMLSIERRWIVSGTPTTGLKQGTEGAFNSYLESEGLHHPPPTRTSMSKKWSRSDLDDVSRLGRMISGFLASGVFSAEEFRRQVTKPLRNAEGPAFGAVERIRQIMSAVMVKHRPGVIDREVALPTSSLTAQKVQLTHLQRLTYNALTGLVGSNVWTSHGEDEDYFLHSRNVADFNQVVANLHLACMWFSSSDMDLEGAIARTRRHMETKEMTEEQRQGSAEAIMHMEAAVKAKTWIEWMRSGAVSVPCEAPSSLPIQILESWSDSPESDSSLLDVNSLRSLRDLNKRGAVVNDVARAGWDERAKGPLATALLKAMERAEKLERAGHTAEAGKEARLHPLYKGDTKAAAEKAKAQNWSSPKSTKRRKMNSSQLASTAPRPLPSLLNISTACSKINYVVGSILAAPDDKFVVFGTYEEIGHVTEALDLVGITSVYVGAHIQRETRKSNLKEFSQPNIPVCLLELNFAARGLTLTVANRMIFLAPVWNLDVQAQAIKRIHRIGQTRPTHIDILVTEGTFEEDIVRRETSARSNEEEKRYSRALIEKPRFVYAEAEGQTDFPVSLVPVGTANEAEIEALQRALAGVPAPSSRAPSAAASREGTGPPPAIEARIRGMPDDVEDDGNGNGRKASKRRRVMFAD